jgi:serine/threonine protein kinase/formylglycine-generating enzyme required for sulfatase activity
MTIDEFGKAVVASGLMSGADLKALWAALPADARPKTDQAFAKLLVDQGKITVFHAKEILSGSATPLVLGDYVLLGKIGAGGMGQVFKAKHRRMDRIVAIKLLPAAMTKDADSIKRFEREVKAAAKLIHPNIVAAYDAGEARGIHYLVMEHVDGQDLAHVAKAAGKLTVNQVTDFVLQAARGLAYAHSKGVIHRDIKPANLLLDKEGVVKILDMGLARFEALEAGPAAAQEGLTQSGQVMGTVDYMAPEQAFDTRRADARADIYSLGCSMYRLLMNENVYGGESLVQKLMAHREKPIPDLCKLRADVPPAVDAVFQKMMAKDPADRYPSAAQLVSALEACRDPGATASFSSSVLSQPLGKSAVSPSNPSAPASGPGSPNATVSDDNRTEMMGNRLLQQIALPEQTMTNAGHEVDTDPKSEVRPGNRRNRKAAGGGKKPPLVLIAAGGAGALLVLVLAVWIIVRDKDGKEIGRVEVPPGSKMEIATDLPAGKEPLLPLGEGGRRPDEGASAAAKGPHPSPLPKGEGAGSEPPKPLIAPFDAKQAHAGQQAWAKRLGTTVEQKNLLGMTLVLIPPGEFLMGSTPEQNSVGVKMAEEIDKLKPADWVFQRLKEEGPQHRVVLTKPLLMGMTEVTIGQFKKFVEASSYVTEAEQYGFGDSAGKIVDEKVTPEMKKKNWQTLGYPVNDDSPVTQVTWNDAVQFCNWLSEQENLKPCYRKDADNWILLDGAKPFSPREKVAAQPTDEGSSPLPKPLTPALSQGERGNYGYRLPTEAEWEYACRAGTTTQFWFGDDVAELEQHEWYNKNVGGRARAVGLKSPNPFRLYDMAGNVREWCSDFYDAKWYEISPLNDPVGPIAGSNRVLRGGHWHSSASYCRSAFHSYYPPSVRYANLGFRAVRAFSEPRVQSSNSDALTR